MLIMNNVSDSETSANLELQLALLGLFANKIKPRRKTDMIIKDTRMWERD